MKTFILKIVLVLGIFFSTGLGQKAIAAENSLNKIGDVEAAYDSHNNVWAFVGVNYNGVQVQIYNDTASGKPGRSVFPLAEKCLSKMIHTPGQPGTEDYILRTRLSAYYGSDHYTVPRTFDITNPSLRYIFLDPKIVYNSYTRTFLAIWTQKSDRLGEQLVGQVFRYNKNKKGIDSWEEPRVLSIVGVSAQYGDLSVSYGITGMSVEEDPAVLAAGNFNRIYFPCIDVTINSDYAIVSAKFYNKDGDGVGRFYPLIRLVPMGLQGNTYHYNYDERYLCSKHDWIEHNRSLDYVSVTMSYDPNSRKNMIYILYSLSDNASGTNLMAIWKTDTDLYPYRDNWKMHPYQFFSVDRVLPCPIIKVGLISAKPIILYSGISTSNSVSVKLIDSDQRIITDIETGVFNSQEYNSGSFIFPCPKIEITHNGCFITFQKGYKQTLDGIKLSYVYIYGKYISLTSRTGDTSLYSLVSGGKPAQRYNECIVHNPAKWKMVCFWGNVELGTRAYESDWNSVSLTTDYPTYSPNLRVSPDPNTAGKINITWNRYPAQTFSGITEVPKYSIYILTSANKVRVINITGTQASWQNAGFSKEVAVILSVTDVSTPRLAIRSPVWVNANFSFVNDLIAGSNMNFNNSGAGSSSGSNSGSSSGSGSRDSDRDGLTDDEENNIYHTNPNQYDVKNMAMAYEAYPMATASSEFSDGNYPAFQAIDGGLEEYDEWATNHEKNGAWLEITWRRAVPIKRFLIHDRRNTGDNVVKLSITIFTKDGGQATFSNIGPLPPGSDDRSTPARPLEYNLPSVFRVNKVRITITETSPNTENIGLAEVKIYNI